MMGFFRFFLLVAFIALAPSALRAEESQENAAPKEQVQSEETQAPETDAPAETQQESISLKTFQDAESLGLFTKPGDGGLGKDFWNGARRSDMLALIPAMPATSQDRVVQKLIFGVLLTAADASKIENDVPPEAGRDLLTLRLEKLLEGGAYTQAFDLYSQLKDEPYHPQLGRAGILAMLYSSQKSSACLEANVISEHFPEDNFAKDISDYCDSSMNPGASAPADKGGLIATLINDKSYRFAYTPESFAKLSQLEQALLVAENKISVDAFNAKAVPPEQIEIILQNADLDPEERLALTARGVEFGLVSTSQLAELYVQNAAPAAGGPQGDATVASTPDALREGDWGQAAYYYNFMVGAAPDEDQWPVIQKVLPLHKELGYAALAPFAAMLPKIEPKNASLEEIKTAVIVMNNSGIAVPSAWTRAINMHSADEGQNDTYALLAASAYLFDSADGKSSESLRNLQDAAASAKPEYKHLVNNIIENVDKDMEPDTNTVNAYEKEISLTFSRDYVMPSVSVWDRAKKASQAKAKTETILLNTVLLRNRALRDVYPGLLRDVLQGFENVGLTDVSEDMAITALLGNIE